MNKQMNKDGSHLHNRSPLSPSQNSGRRARRVVFCCCADRAAAALHPLDAARHCYRHRGKFTNECKEAPLLDKAKPKAPPP